MSDWLYRFVSDPDQWMSRHRPWSQAIVGVLDWSVATNGRIIVALRDGGVSEDPGVIDYDRRAAEHALSPYFGPPTTPVVRTTLSALWSFVGHIDACRCCNCGEPWECEIDRALTPRLYCEDCDGTGVEIAHEPRPVSIGGHPFDANLLARGLAPELADLGDGVSMWLLAGRSGVLMTDPVALCVDGGKWRVWCCAMAPDAGCIRDAGGLARLPTFHPDQVFAQLWLERDDPDVRPVLADWLDERGDPYHEVLRG